MAAITKIPIFLKIGLWAARRISGQDLLLARLLAWYPKAAVSSGILESLIARHDGKLDERILKMVRMKVSFTAAQVNYWARLIQALGCPPSNSS